MSESALKRLRLRIAEVMTSSCGAAAIRSSRPALVVDTAMMRHTLWITRGDGVFVWGCPGLVHDASSRQRLIALASDNSPLVR